MWFFQELLRLSPDPEAQGAYSAWVPLGASHMEIVKHVLWFGSCLFLPKPMCYKLGLQPVTLVKGG